MHINSKSSQHTKSILTAFYISINQAVIIFYFSKEV